MTTVTCELCKEAGSIIEICNKIIHSSFEEELMEIGQAMAYHLQISHNAESVIMVREGAVFNGFRILQNFSSSNPAYKASKESMRTALLTSLLDGMDIEDVRRLAGSVKSELELSPETEIKEVTNGQV